MIDPPTIPTAPTPAGRAIEFLAHVIDADQMSGPHWLAGTALDQMDALYNELSMHLPELTDDRRHHIAANLVCRLHVEQHPNDAVVVAFTDAEAMRLYASAASYETTVQRVEGVGESNTAVAQSALTKLAAASNGVAVPE